VSVIGPDGSEERRIETEALDLSEGGILFKADREIAPQALLKVLIHLPSEKIEAIAKVARVLPGEGSGRRIGAYFLWHGPVE
jgi:hypothetical protein